MMQVWVRTNKGDVMRLGDAQKARKADEGLTYEIVGDNDVRGWQSDRAADARLHPDSGKVKGNAVGGPESDGRESAGGQHPDEDVGGMGEKARRPHGRSRRDEGSRA
jgi:hypothetical protein